MTRRARVLAALVTAVLVAVVASGLALSRPARSTEKVAGAARCASGVVAPDRPCTPAVRRTSPPPAGKPARPAVTSLALLGPPPSIEAAPDRISDDAARVGAAPRSLTGGARAPPVVAN
jgi:hypothetical protein